MNQQDGEAWATLVSSIVEMERITGLQFPTVWIHVFADNYEAALLEWRYLMSNGGQP